jgi:hypothetical protein
MPSGELLWIVSMNTDVLETSLTEHALAIGATGL